MKGFKAALGILALCNLSLTVRGADIRADTNRDGTVDVKGDSDLGKCKYKWTESCGAIFLANIGDTDRQCSKMLDVNSTGGEDHFDDCNDASDHILHAPQYLAPLRTMPISDLSETAVGSVTADEVSEPLVRIFHRRDQRWEITTNETEFTAAELSRGLELGIDARDIRRPGAWDGRTNVTFEVLDKEGGYNEVDTVQLRVAPLLTHNHLQRAQEIFVARPEGPNMKAFVAGLEEATRNSGIEKPVRKLDSDYPEESGTPGLDIWAQDFVEPGYMSMPGPDGKPITLKVMMRSAQDTRPAGRLMFTEIRNTGIGAVQFLGSQYTSFDSTGNHECVPPYVHGDKKYPAGRVILGGDFETDDFPHSLRYLQAQETQDPIRLDTSWLTVGHVDEFIQFLPSDNERGWVIMVSDPRAGVQLLKDAEDAGYGDIPAFSRDNDAEVCKVPNITISYLIHEEQGGNLTIDNEYCAKKIDENLEILKKETGITDEDIHYLPAVYRWVLEDDFDCGPGSDGKSSPSGDDTEAEAASRGGSIHMAPMTAYHAKTSLGKRQEHSQGHLFRSMGAYYPGMVNGLVLSDSEYLSPKPTGPIINGVDIFEEAAREAYGPVGYNVTFLDDWLYHQGGGEVHCGTNSIREVDTSWW